MPRPALLIVSDFLVERLADLKIDADILGPQALASGLPPEVAGRVEAVACAGVLSNALMDALPALRLVACFSTGYEGIDLAHLWARNIALTTGAGVNAHDVADQAVALFMALWHGVIVHDASVRQGHWRESVRPRPSLRGRRAGLVGLGRIGTAIADRLAVHDMKVAWWGPREKPEVTLPRAPTLIALSEQSDVLFIASRSSADNIGLIDAPVLKALGSQGILVNVARGSLVDSEALVAALRGGVIGGAGLDVFTDEPTDPARWRGLPNLILSPHVAGYTWEAGRDLVEQLRANIERYFSGGALLTPARDVC